MPAISSAVIDNIVTLVWDVDQNIKMSLMFKHIAFVILFSIFSSCTGQVKKEEQSDVDAKGAGELCF